MRLIPTILVLIVGFVGELSAQVVSRPDESSTVGRVVPDVELIDENGDPFRLSSLEGTPLVISPVFTSCPHTCTMITESLRDALSPIGEPGGHFQVLTVSFDDADSPESMREYRTRMDLPKGWRLAVAAPADRTSLFESLDFQYVAMDEGGFAHTNAVILLSSDHRVSSYVYGMMFTEEELRKALHSAASGEGLLERYRTLMMGLAVLAGLVLGAVLYLTRGKKAEMV